MPPTSRTSSRKPPRAKPSPATYCSRRDLLRDLDHHVLPVLATGSELDLVAGLQPDQQGRIGPKHQDHGGEVELDNGAVLDRDLASLGVDTAHFTGTAAFLGLRRRNITGGCGQGHGYRAGKAGCEKHAIHSLEDASS